MPNNFAWVNSGTVTNAIMKNSFLKLFYLSFPFLSFFSLFLLSFFFSRLVCLFSITLSFLSISPLISLSLSQLHHLATLFGHTGGIALPSRRPYRSWIATPVTLPHPPRHAMPPNVSLIYELGFFGFVCVFGWVLRSEFLKLLVVCGGGFFGLLLWVFFL